MEKSEFERNLEAAKHAYEIARDGYTRRFQVTPEDQEEFQRFLEMQAGSFSMMRLKMHVLANQERFRAVRKERIELVDGVTTDRGWIGWDYPKTENAILWSLKPPGLIQLGDRRFLAELSYAERIIQPEPDPATVQHTVHKITLYDQTYLNDRTSNNRRSAFEQRQRALADLEILLERPILVKDSDCDNYNGCRAWITEKGYVKAGYSFCPDELEENLEFNLTLEIERAYADRNSYFEQLGTLLYSFK